MQKTKYSGCWNYTISYWIWNQGNWTHLISWVMLCQHVWIRFVDIKSGCDNQEWHQIWSAPRFPLTLHNQWDVFVDPTIDTRIKIPNVKTLLLYIEIELNTPHGLSNVMSTHSHEVCRFSNWMSQLRATPKFGVPPAPAEKGELTWWSWPIVCQIHLPPVCSNCTNLSPNHFLVGLTNPENRVGASPLEGSNGKNVKRKTVRKGQHHNWQWKHLCVVDR